jgi:8-oxo-dGTP pyrophosphatase MutT (NUDIX family)
MKTISRNIVSALIFSKDNKLFMGKKDPQGQGVYADCWHIPGGGVDAGETFQAALVREIKEETGIDISKYNTNKLNYVDHGTSEKVLKDTGEKVFCEMTFNIFKITISDKTADEILVKLEDDLIQYKWFGLAELKSIKVTPPSVRLFRTLGYI